MGPSPAQVALRVTHIGLWQPPCIDQTCYFRAQKETRKVPMFGDAYRCVCLLIFEIWCYTMRGSWFRSVSTWGVQEGLIWSVSNSILLLLSCCSFDRRERLGQTPFGSRWSVSPRIPQKNVTRVKWHRGYTTMNNLSMPSISNRNVSYVWNQQGAIWGTQEVWHCTSTCG
jgi:hypothetical protein